MVANCTPVAVLSALQYQQHTFGGLGTTTSACCCRTAGEWGIVPRVVPPQRYHVACCKFPCAGGAWCADAAAANAEHARTMHVALAQAHVHDMAEPASIWRSSVNAMAHTAAYLLPAAGPCV
jgi:hypothetical protein